MHIMRLLIYGLFNFGGRGWGARGGMAPRGRGGRGGPRQGGLEGFLTPAAPSAAGPEPERGEPEPELSELSGLETSTSSEWDKREAGGAGAGAGAKAGAGAAAGDGPGPVVGDDDDLDLEAFMSADPFASSAAGKKATRKRTATGTSAGTAELGRILEAKRQRASYESGHVERQKSLHKKMEQIKEHRALLDAEDNDDGGLGQMLAIERRGRAEIEALGTDVAVEAEPSRFSEHFVRPLNPSAAERVTSHPIVDQSIARLPMQLQTSSHVRALVRQEILAGGWGTVTVGEQRESACRVSGISEWSFGCAAYANDSRAAFGGLKTFAHICNSGSANSALAHLALPLQTSSMRRSARELDGAEPWAPSQRDVEDALESLGYTAFGVGKKNTRKKKQGMVHVNGANVFKLIGALPASLFRDPLKHGLAGEDWGLNVLVGLLRMSVSERVGGGRSCLPDIIRDIMQQIPAEIWDIYVDEAAVSIGSGFESTSSAYHAFSQIPADSIRGRALLLKVACVILNSMTKEASKGSLSANTHCLVETGRDGAIIPTEVVSSLLEAFGDPKKLVSDAWKHQGLEFWDIYNLLRLFDTVVWQWQASETRSGNEEGTEEMRGVLKACTDFVRKIGSGIGTSSERSSAEVVRTLSTEMESTFNHLYSKYSALNDRG